MLSCKLPEWVCASEASRNASELERDIDVFGGDSCGQDAVAFVLQPCRVDKSGLGTALEEGRCSFVQILE